jgi:hypothetical protein
LVAELARLVEEASAALTILDADTLDELGRRAEALAAMNLGASSLDDRAIIPVLEARFRKFSAVLKATSENLAILERANGQEIFGQEIFGQERFGMRRGTAMEGYPAAQRGLFESLGLYDDADGGSSIWPRAASTSGFSNRHAAGRA